MLVVSLAFLPADVVRADMITTELAVSATAQTYRDSILAFLNRPDVEYQLRTLGVERPFAEERVAAMTAEEVQTLAGKLDSLSAGGQMSSGGGGYGGGAGGGAAFAIVLVIVLIAFLVWWITRGGQTNPSP
ncbi:MAG TPA: PA2779 family protein [Burkholderiales bacterium]|nr:PA2779 family protein [Burkholderiales bacterium]